jgi:hypothetical protein
MHGIAVSTELLQVPLCYQTLNISLADIELRVFREVNGPAPPNQIKSLPRVDFCQTHPYSV